MNETPNEVDAETLRLVAVLLEANGSTLEGLRVEVTPVTGIGSKSWRKGYMTARLCAEIGAWGFCSALGLRSHDHLATEARSADDARLALRNMVASRLEVHADNARHDARKRREQAQKLLDEAVAHESIATKIADALRSSAKAA